MAQDTASETPTTVGLFVATNKRARKPMWQQVAICSLAQAEQTIERGTARMIAVNLDTNAILAASDERDMA